MSEVHLDPKSVYYRQGNGSVCQKTGMTSETIERLQVGLVLEAALACGLGKCEGEAYSFAI